MRHHQQNLKANKTSQPAWIEEQFDKIMSQEKQLSTTVNNCPFQASHARIEHQLLDGCCGIGIQVIVIGVPKQGRGDIHRRGLLLLVLAF